MKLLIIGASGVLGSRLYNDAIKKKYNVMGTFYSHECEGLFHLDMTDRSGVHRIFNFFRPEAVVICGGVTDVDLCEEKPKLAEEVNIKGTINLIKKTREYEARLALLSSDFIFNGENGPYAEDDKAMPLNVYGRTKLEAENAVRESLKDYLIIRTAQLYGPDYRGRNFAVKIIKNMKSGKEVHAAEDLYSTPTYVGSLSACIIELLKRGKNGILNVAGSDFINRVDYINKISDIFNLDKNLIKNVTLRDLKLKAKRPKRAGLKIDKIKKEISAPLHSCDEGLRLLKKELS